MMLSDAEFHILQDRWASQRQNLTLGEECPVCKGFSLDLVPLCGCSRHRVCSDCSEHARQSDVTRCVFCPVPDATLHLQCPHCASVTVTDADALHGCVCIQCRMEFQPVLLRIFKRGPHTYTNFLTPAEKTQLASDFAVTAGRVQCPTCRHPVERASACNELFHCGHEKICAACGQFAFRWEAGLIQHRRESGCACVPDPNADEGASVRERWRQSLMEAGVQTN